MKQSSDDVSRAVRKIQNGGYVFDTILVIIAAVLLKVYAWSYIVVIIRQIMKLGA